MEGICSKIEYHDLSFRVKFKPIRRCFIVMVHVKKQPGDSDESIIRKFSRKVIDAGIVNEAKRRQFYLKPSLAKKLKQEESRRNRRRIIQ